MEAEKAVQFPIDRAHSVNEDVRTKKGNVRIGVSNSKKTHHLAVKTARRHELVVPVECCSGSSTAAHPRRSRSLPRGAGTAPDTRKRFCQTSHTALT